MTVMAGGSQKVFGEGGALGRVTSGKFLTEGGGFGEAFRNIGQVAKRDSAGNSATWTKHHGGDSLSFQSADSCCVCGGLHGSVQQCRDAAEPVAGDPR